MPIDSHLSYLQKNAYCPAQIEVPVQSDLNVCVVIPCHNEPDLIGSLAALWDCLPTVGAVEVITVINAGVHHPEAIQAQNRKTLAEAEAWAAAHQDPRRRFFFLFHDDLKRKHAGVGLARKIGMDEAVARFEKAGNPNGVILCFDADSRCDPNYLLAVEGHFQAHPEVQACSIHFEHPLEGALAPALYAGILRYELYLRYYVLGLRFAGYPHAYQTIGSSMAVRCDAYQIQGGMNRRKAGEDFYFLHKLIPLGGFSELNSTRVIPSPRASDRVPFGTGRAMMAWEEELDGGDAVVYPGYPVYAPEAFVALKGLCDQVALLWQHPDPAEVLEGLAPLLRDYLKGLDFVAMVRSTQEQTRSEEMFVKRFFRWLNGLRVLQYFHFSRDHGVENVDVGVAARVLAGWYGVAGFGEGEAGLRGMLEWYRGASPGTGLA